MPFHRLFLYMIKVCFHDRNPLLFHFDWRCCYRLFGDDYVVNFMRLLFQSNCYSFFNSNKSDKRCQDLGGECSIQLSYEDISDFWLKIRHSAAFQASGSVAGYSITYAFWMNYSIQLSSIHSPLVASYITLTLTDSNYRVLFPIVQRRQASPFLRRHLLYPFN